MQKQESTPVACVFQAFDKWAYKIMIPGQKDDIRVDGFQSEGEAWEDIDKKYPACEKVATHGEYIERRKQNLAALGTDFKAEATWWR